MSNGGDNRVQDRLKGLNPGLGRDAVAEVEDMAGVAGVVGEDGLGRGGRRGGLRVRLRLTGRPPLAGSGFTAGVALASRVPTPGPGQE